MTTTFNPGNYVSAPYRIEVGTYTGVPGTTCGTYTGVPVNTYGTYVDGPIGVRPAGRTEGK